DKTLEAPLLAQYIVEKPGVSAGGYVIQIHISAHKASRAGLLRRVKWHEIDILQQHFRDVGGVVVSSSFRGAVTGEMLHTRQHTLRSKRLTLTASYLSAGHCCAQIRILAGALSDSSPAGIVSDINHWSKGPVDAGRARIFASDFLCLFLYSRIPGGGH